MTGRVAASSAARASLDAELAPEVAAAEVAATRIAIAGLRKRLKNSGAVQDPGVRRELRKLEEQLAQIEQDDRKPGRHRSPGTRPPVRREADLGAVELKPDPAASSTAAEFISVLWQFRAWSGDPSWRRIAARAGQQVVHSTMHAAMRGSALPKLHVVEAIIVGCGGTEEDQSAFATAWWRLHSSPISAGSRASTEAPAPIAALQLTAS